MQVLSLMRSADLSINIIHFPISLQNFGKQVNIVRVVQNFWGLYRRWQHGELRGCQEHRSIYTETKKFNNSLQIRIFITEIHVEINTEFFTVNSITILSNTKYFVHCWKISFVWRAVAVIKYFQKDKLAIFWSSSTCIWDDSGQFWWILTYRGQFLDVMQNEFAVRNLSRLHVI